MSKFGLFVDVRWPHMVGALDTRSRGPASSLGRRYCVVFLGKTFYSHSASLHRRCINGYQRI